MHAPAPELMALRKLAEAYPKKFETLLQAELQEMGAKPVVDSNGKEWQLGAKGLTQDGFRVTVTRIDIKSKRIVIQHADESKQLLMGHRVEMLAKGSNKGALKGSGDVPAGKAGDDTPAKQPKAAKTEKAGKTKAAAKAEQPAQVAPELISTDEPTEAPVIEPEVILEPTPADEIPDEA